MAAILGFLLFFGLPWLIGKLVAEAQAEKENERRRIEEAKRKAEYDRAQAERRQKQQEDARRREEERQRKIAELNRQAEQRQRERAETKRKEEERKRIEKEKIDRQLNSYRETFRYLSAQEIEKRIYNASVSASDQSMMLSVLTPSEKEAVLKAHATRLEAIEKAKKREELKLQKKAKENRLRGYQLRFEYLKSKEIEPIIYDKQVTAEEREEMLSVLSPQMRTAVNKVHQGRLEQEEKAAAEERARQEAIRKAQELKAAEERRLQVERERAAAEERARLEARQRERDIQEAKGILNEYGEAAKRCGCSFSAYSISYEQAQQVLRKKDEIRTLASKICRLKNAVNGWFRVGVMPHYFFYWYYPTRFTDVTSTSDRARKLIWNFKEGLRSSEVADLVSEKLQNTFNSSDLSDLCLICVPASTRAKNDSRFQSFVQKVCDKTRMTNGFNYITIQSDREAAHLGGTENAEYSYNEYAIKGSYIVLFDDVVTSGHSMRNLKNKLESLGAIVVCAISIGRTYSDYHGENHQPHPYTGGL